MTKQKNHRLSCFTKKQKFPEKIPGYPAPQGKKCCPKIEELPYHHHTKINNVLKNFCSKKILGYGPMGGGGFNWGFLRYLKFEFSLIVATIHGQMGDLCQIGAILQEQVA